MAQRNVRTEKKSWAVGGFFPQILPGHPSFLAIHPGHPKPREPLETPPHMKKHPLLLLQ